ncbi:MAG: hypothetical protein WC695_11205 [Candidatus Omnitrophota bacterium]
MLFNRQSLSLDKVLMLSIIAFSSLYIINLHSKATHPITQNTTKIPADFRKTNQPLMEAVEFTGISEGSKVFTLKAKQLLLRNPKIEPFGFRVAIGKAVELQDVSVAFYLNGKPVSYLHSNTAVLDKKSKNIVFQGKPLMLTKEHRSLSAREIQWDNLNRSIQAKGDCVLSGNGIDRHAEAIKTEIDLNSFSVIELKKSKEF